MMFTKVLIVDDNPVIRPLIARMITFASCEVIIAESGAQALALLEAATKGIEASRLLVLTDIDMPGMDGYTLAKQIHLHPQWRNIKVAFMSGSDEPKNLQIDQVAAFFFLTKPFTFAAIQNLLQ